MNILFVAHLIYPCKIGGTELFNYHLIKELSKSHKIFLLTCCKEEIDLDAEIIRINRRKFGLARISLPLLNLSTVVKLRNKIDMIHLSYMSPVWIPWIPFLLAKKLFGIPYIISIRDGEMTKWKPLLPYELLFRNARELIGVSPILKEEFENRTGRDVRFIPSGLPFKCCMDDRDELRMKYGLGLSDIIIIAIGSIKEIKGSDVLLNAFLKLGEKFVRKHNLKLLFTGNGDMRKGLEAKTKEEKFIEYVKFLGNIPHREIPALYKIADIYIIPSLFEGTSNAMLEAMFNKMPIIGSDTRGINNMINHGKNGLLFEVNNSNDLRDKIVYLVKNENVAEQIAQEAKKTYDNCYNYETVVKEYLEVYGKVGEKQNKNEI